ncbi:hypothetical protein MMC07_009587, partial [Pseudocyphellaria aurata]|nr:hypothetical protein [Pseudocyphellaria aurata]
TCVASIARLVSLVNYIKNGGVDNTYDLALPFTWSLIEPCTGIVCACLPILPPIFRSCSAIFSRLNQKLRAISAAPGRQSSETSPPSLNILEASTTSSASERRSSGESSSSPETLQVPTSVVLAESVKTRLESPNLDVGELDPMHRTSFRELIQSSHRSWLLAGSQEELPQIQIREHASDAARESSWLWV